MTIRYESSDGGHIGQQNKFWIIEDDVAMLNFETWGFRLKRKPYHLLQYDINKNVIIQC